MPILETRGLDKRFGGIIAAQRFAGGPNPEGNGWVPNITQKGLSDWSEKDIAYFLESGQTPDGDSVGGSMVAVTGVPFTFSSILIGPGPIATASAAFS